MPKSSLIDKITKINLSRLKPLQNITLGAKVVGDKGETFESHAHFIAGKNGEVDVCRDSSLGGSYSGVSPMGLLWSMQPALGQRKGIRLMKSDVTKPFNIVLSCFDGHVIPNECSLQPLSSETFQKWYIAEGVKRIPVREGRIRGTLFLPPGDGPFPGKTLIWFADYYVLLYSSLQFAIYLFIHFSCICLLVRSFLRPSIYQLGHASICLACVQPPPEWNTPVCCQCLSCFLHKSSNHWNHFD